MIESMAGGNPVKPESARLQTDVDKFSEAAKLVLVADDDPVYAAVMEQVLLQHGARGVVLAADGEQALTVLRQKPGEIDAIILDLSMPNLDGVRFMRRASELGYKGRIAVASSEKSQVRESVRRLACLLGLNCTGAFAKPVDFNRIASHVLAVSPKPAAAASSVPIDTEVFNAALRRSRLLAYYQPKVDLATGRINGAEALARMSDAQGRLLDAAQLINLAEKNGRISDITWRMVEIITRDLVQMRREFAGPLEIAFNISASVLEDDRFPITLVEIVRQSGLLPQDFILELTESRIPIDRVRSLEALTVLRMQGFGLAIDDFGTGYSNIDQLRMFPFSELKIDRNFISAAGHDGFALACVEASVAMARELGLSIVAEGVETQAELELATKYGVDMIQGYLFGKPMPLGDFLAYLSNSQAKPVGLRARDLILAG